MCAAALDYGKSECAAVPNGEGECAAVPEAEDQEAQVVDANVQHEGAPPAGAQVGYTLHVEPC